MNNFLLAQITNPVLPASIGKGAVSDGGNALGKLISSLIGALFIAGFLLAVVFVIQGGISWITAGGDKTKLETARDQITNSLVGIIVVGASYALTTLVANFFGLDFAHLSIPTLMK